MSYYSTYRWCAVPECKNTSVKTPNKLWIQVPTDINMRKTWFKVARRDPGLLTKKSRLYFCEDHFDLEHDMENYLQYKLMGSIKKIRLKPLCIPSRFDCNRKHMSASNESHLAEATGQSISISKDSVQDHVEEVNVKASSSCVKEELGAGRKAAEELDKFKRRLIRAVARLLLQEKVPEDEIWAHLRKETGCDCELLWSRMRALTERKLARLLEANDRVCAVPKAARMSLTDWLLFDLVLVHQKIDLIGQDNTKDPVPLVDLFELVKKFDIEGLSGDDLAEAWSSATLHYNKLGHQCSPMLLQRRWYQLKEMTRTKFYDFWYAYRGTAKRLYLAEPFTPTPLQAAIAKRYKTLVTTQFMEWEELIEHRLVTLPEEFERKMLEMTECVRKPVSDDVPDLVLIEPKIDTIDLGVESDDNEENNREPENLQLPVVKVKEEPQDIDIDIDETQVQLPKKSLYEEVLESTAIENEKLDNMDTEEQMDELAIQQNKIEETIENTLRAREESFMPLITSIVGNVSDSCVLGNVDDSTDRGNDKDTCGNVDETSVVYNVDNSDCCNDKNTGVCGTVADTTVVGNVDESSCGNDKDTGICGNDNDICDIVDDDNGCGNDEDTDTCSVGNDSSTCSNVEDASGDNTSLPGNVDDISKVVATEEKISDIDTLNADIIKSTVTNIASNVKYVEIIENTSYPVIISDSDEEDNIKDGKKRDENTVDQPMEADLNPEITKFNFTVPLSNVNEDALMAEDNLEKKSVENFKQEVTTFSFGELSNDISFADDGIEFADDGIAYIDEDSNIDTKIKIKVDDNEEKAEHTPKIDAKLLMCPIIYTTRLDDMGVFQTQPFDHVSDKQLLDIITSKSKPVKMVPVSDTNVTSDDDDCHENVIPESHKVKPSSYMLQKPRSRSYNPIQLCKNPDFNTRLKRLTVGFFSSPRNRVLIKTCKPLTIDLSKAFESKLISGTLYLKPSDHNVKTEIIDDTESCQNVSVVPSAMPVQSLIDNSKIADLVPLLQSHVESLKPANNVASTSERNKVINLPDISEIRRINQRLLTAEVTPIQVQNNRPQVPVTIVTSLGTPTHSTQTSITTAQTDKDLLTEACDSRGPPKLVDITKDSPTKNTEHYLLAERISSSTESNYLSTERHHSTTGRNSLTDFRVFANRSGMTHIGRPPRMINGKRLWPQKPASLPWKPRQYYRPEIPWLSKNSDAAMNNKKIEETLLTLDTLNKMLYLLADKDEPVIDRPKSKTKSQPEPQSQSQLKKKGKRSCRELKRQSLVDDGKSDNPSEQTKKCKVNVKAATNYPPEQKEMRIQITDKSYTEPTDKTKDSQKREIQYCCWSRQRMLQLLFSRKRIPLHGCKYGKCKCCCASLLKEYILHDLRMKRSEEATTSDKDNVTQENNGTESYKGTQAGVETPVETPAQVPVKVTVKFLDTETVQIHQGLTVIDVEASNTRSTNITENELIDVDAMDQQDDVPTLGGEVSVITSQVEVESPVSSGTGTVTVPVLRKDKLISCVAPEQLTNLHSSNKLSGGALLSAKTVLPVTVSPGTISPPTFKKFLAAKKLNPPYKKNVMPPKFKSFTSLASKSFKEKMIFLNSKQISEKPTENPIFLGKNKILLTTVKFPPNLKLFEEAKQALVPSLNLPKGVQLICHPHGLISYTIDQNVAVNATDLAKMPAIIAAIRAHINLNTVEQEQLKTQNVTPKVGVTEGEVVDLIDDDDDDTVTHSVNESINNETLTVTEVQTSKESLTKTSDDNNDSCNNQTETSNEAEENRVDLNIDKNPTETRTENNQNESALHNTVTKIQENDQESSHNEIPSTSVELEQYQPDPLSKNESGDIEDRSIPSSQNVSAVIQNYPEPSNENVSADAQDDPEPSSQNASILDHTELSKHNFCTDVQVQPESSCQNISTEVHEASDDKVQDQPDPSSQNVSADVQDHPDVQEISIEQVQEQSKLSSQDVSTEVPEESTSEPSRNKSKNILSDLMEMSGIFDEDITPAPEGSSETLLSAPEASLVPPVFAPVVVVEQQPALAPVVTESSPLPQRPIMMPSNFTKLLSANTPVPQVLKSPIGELSPITSLYELKYACLNKGLFFKLDFETGYIVPINVCMKQHQKSQQPHMKNLASKSVIDLTEDDDAGTVASQNKTASHNTPSKRSILIPQNSTTSGTRPTNHIPVKPLKLFKAVKPSILRRLKEGKLIIEKATNSTTNTHEQEEHKHKRKQFLKKIDLSAEEKGLDAGGGVNSLPTKQYVKKIKVKRNLLHTNKVSNTANPHKEPTPMSLYRASPEKVIATTIVSDDSSDEETLANIAKRKKANETAPPVVSNEVDMELEIPTSVVYAHESEIIAPEIPLGIDQNQSNEEDENCILGV